MFRTVVIAAVVLLMLGGWLFRSWSGPVESERQVRSQSGPAESGVQVEIYLASYCSESRRAKVWLESHAVEFVEYDIEKDLERRREFYARGGKGIPLLFVRGHAMHGFDTREFERLLATR